MNLRKGTILQDGKYTIVRFISSGGFGCTYEVRHNLLDMRFAIKEFFPKSLCDRDEGTSRVTIGTKSNKELVMKLQKKFIEEAQSVFRMHHPNIVKVSDVFEENGTAYYVMDYIDGKSLSQIIASRGPLPEDEALNYINQVADALDYVHSLDRLHLDVKPGNIMVSAGGHVTLIDFGTSKHYDAETGENTSTLMGVNTPGYAPHEQRGKSFTTFSPATDIYALGATLYKLLSGVTPPDAVDLLSEDATLEPLSNNISAVTRNAVYTAMRSKRKDRPQSISEFLDLLNSDDTTVFDVDVTENVDVKEAEPQRVNIKTPKNDTSVYLRYALAAVTAVVLCAAAVIWWQLKDDGLRQPVDGIANSVDSVAAVSDNEVVDGHQAVDLGLSVKWATANVGAATAEDGGTFFAWGETEPAYDGNYSEDKSRLLGNENIVSIGGNYNYDVAARKWGGSWRMPTRREFEELRNSCDWIWTNQNGANGYKVTSRINGNSIFIPAAGYHRGTESSSEGSYGDYWTSTAGNHSLAHAECFYFTADNYDKGYGYRYGGRCVRPVIDK